jgi:hypothetical protein
MSGTVPAKEQVMAQWFENSYRCRSCDIEWTDEWSCTCDDRCPECDAEIEPFDSVDLSRPLTEEDYLGAARIITGSPFATASQATDDQAREYAEAILEGGEYRFEPNL